MDSRVKVTTSWSPCKDIWNYFLLIFENDCYDGPGDSGTAEFYYNTNQLNLDFLNIIGNKWVTNISKTTVTNSSLYNAKVTCDFQDLFFGEQGVIYLPMTARVGEDTLLNIGSNYISDNCQDIDIIPDSTIYSRGSPHDPNVTTDDRDCLYPGLPNEETITYTVRFQNEGTAEAQNVVIKDYLDDIQLNLNTLVIVESEYSYSYTIAGNLLTIIFTGIDLPGLKQPGHNYSFSDTESFIKFKINAKSNLKYGKIYNQAEIYFDSQPVVVTNTSKIPVKDCELDVNTEESIISKINIIPNPAADVLFIEGIENEEVTLNVINSQGELIFSKSKVDQSNSLIDVSMLSSGIYFVQIKNKMINITKKVVKI